MSSRVIWDEGRVAGRELVALGAACTLSLVALDIALTGEVGWFLDLGFVPLCIALALAVRPGDFFEIGILPPLLLVGAFTILAVSRPEAIAQPDDAAVQAVVSGLALHSLTLVLGYLLSLGVLAIRDRRQRTVPPTAPLRGRPGERRSGEAGDIARTLADDDRRAL
ncbi:hypothetical protein GCM10022215_16310 [Nocardioides fonticola]|uniref:DUF6542 domain-containing protein n=1 Tax=Nocardioides fonticola TaxID=450363 RepID=A0ABP7XJM8_9ACTN